MALIPRDEFSQLSWWGRLDEASRATVVAEGQGLARALVDHGISRLQVGEHLTRLRAVLEPQRLFLRFLRHFHFSQRTAYRYIASYDNAQRELPEPVLRAAMARGYNMLGDSAERPLGVYTDVVKRLPPPHSKDPDKIQEWLTEVEEKRRRRSGHGRPVPVEEHDPETMLKECFRFVDIRFRRLPPQGKRRAEWVRQLSGMLLAQLGVGNEQRIAPVAVPEAFRAKVGRPRGRKPKAD